MDKSLLDKLEHLEEVLQPPVALGNPISDAQWGALVELVNLLPEIRRQI